MANAFHSLRRDIFHAEAKRRTPGLYSMLWQAYSGSTTLFYGRKYLVSATGIQQGDMIGTALFSMEIDSLVQSLEAKFNV